jgi:lysophospholipase L1-like esterase
MKRVHSARRGRVVAIVSMVCLTALLVLGSGSALARSKHKPKPVAPAKNLPVIPRSQYLALGDSVTFGYMEPTVVPAPNYGDAASFPGYPEQLGARLRLSVANASCPGETSASLINASAPSNGCENSPSHNSSDNYRNHPLHVKYKGSQLAFALSYLHSHHNVRLVTLMIGANDFFLCQETTSDACASEQTATAAAVTKNIHTILSAVRNKAHYNGQLVIVNYYSLNYAVPAVNAQSQLLNKVQDDAAKPFGVKIADGYGELQAAAAHSGANPCTAGLLTQLTAGGCGIHPSYAGQTLLAQALEKTITIG